MTVTNTGERAGDEVVQLYVHDVAASIAQPVRRLRGFERVTLERARAATVTFELGEEDLGFWTNDPAGVPRGARPVRRVRGHELDDPRRGRRSRPAAARATAAGGRG
ncbi:fibronectin type III-like domain-contianing protein [Streptomyces sp. KL116D]|uniref:fibronectin type III-like domain-contianing protein n=1 Tax=Streptomyces sp. KL116D TaxID=3045152 RepID=UPI003556DD15